MNFQSKTFSFIGDSIIAQGECFRALRAYFKSQKKDVFCFNNGIAGNRIDTVANLLDEDLSVINPDIAVLSFGANDLGIWLYDAKNNETPELIKERAFRFSTYENGALNAIKALEERGVKPVICSPICFNANISEDNEILTEKDNKEKAEVTWDTLYTKKTFENINKGLFELRNIAEKIANGNGAEFWDIYSDTLKAFENDCYLADGTHLSAKGQTILAEIFISHITGKKNVFFSDIPEDSETEKIEKAERAYYFMKYNLAYYKYNKIIEGKPLIDAIENIRNEDGYINGLTEERLNGFLSYAKNPEDNRRLLVQKVKS